MGSEPGSVAAPEGPASGRRPGRAEALPSFRRAFVCVQVPLLALWLNNGFDDAAIYSLDQPPSFLLQRLRSVEQRLLNETEREIFKRDGVLIVRDVIQDMRIFDHFVEFGANWRSTHTGRMGAFVLEGPLGALAASALGVSAVRVLEMNVWAQPLNLPFGIGSVGNWHQDYPADDGLLPIVTTWISLSEDARALEFAIGSHKRLATQFCSSTHPWQIWYLPDECVRQAYNNSFEALTFNMGDVVIFHGNILHQGLNEGEKRVAIAVRWVAADAQFTARNFYSNDLLMFARHFPEECASFNSSAFPVIYPPEVSLDDWRLLPTLHDFFALLKFTEDYQWGVHRSLPKCNKTWDHGADL